MFTIFLNMTTCSLGAVYQRLRRTWCLNLESHFHQINPVCRGSKFLGKVVPVYQTTGRHIPKDHNNGNIQRPENLVPHDEFS
jgi:hypothetical protein